jgi:hypothetical protein
MAITSSEQTESIERDQTGRATREAMKLAGRAGLLSTALGVAGVIVDEMWMFPGTGATAGEIASFVDTHRSGLLIALVLSTITVALWLVFGVGVWLWMRATARDESFLATCFLAGLVSFVTLLFAGFTSCLVLIYRAPAASDPRLLYDLAFGLLAMSGVPTALALCAYAVQTFRENRLAGWTAWVALAAALANLMLLASLIIRSGFFSLEGGVIIALPGTLFVWIIGMSVTMIRADRSAAAIGG